MAVRDNESFKKDIQLLPCLNVSFPLNLSMKITILYSTDPIMGRPPTEPVTQGRKSPIGNRLDEISLSSPVRQHNVTRTKTF